MGYKAFGLGTAVLMATSVALSACGGGGGGSSPSPVKSPGAKALPYVIGGSVSGLTSPGLVVENQWGFTPEGEDPVSGTDTLDIAGTSFVFPTAVDTGYSYSASIIQQPEQQFCVLENGSGVIVDASIENIAISCHDLSTPVQLDTEAGTATGLQIAADAEGNVLAVWGQEEADGVTGSVWYSRYSKADESWGTAARVESSSLNIHEISIRLSMAPSGDAVVTWEQDDINQLTDIVAYRFDSQGLQWDAGTVLDDAVIAEDAVNSRVGMDAAGNIIVVWNQNGDVYASHWSETLQQWGQSALIEARAQLAGEPSLVVGDQGDAIVVWDEVVPGATDFQIVGAFFDPATESWMETGSLQVVPNSPNHIRVAMDDAKNAMVVWHHINTEYNISDVFAKYYHAGADAWGSVVRIKSLAGYATNPEVIFDDSGNAIAVWSQGAIHSNTFSAITQSWGTPVSIGSTGTAEHHPEFAMNGSGDIVAVWYNNNTDILSAVRSGETGMWSEASVIENLNTGRSLLPKIAVGGDDWFTVGWEESSTGVNPIRDILAIRVE